MAEQMRGPRLRKREELLQAMAHGSAAAWGHLNLLGEYDFSEDKLQDSVGIKPPKRPTKPSPVLGVPESPKILYAQVVGKNPVGLCVPLLG